MEKEYIFLKYFEEQGIGFCPKAISYNKEHDYLIEKFIEGKEVSQKDFSKEQIDLFAKQLYQLFSLDVEEFHNFCKKHNLKTFEYEDPIQSLKKYGFNRFEDAKKGKVDAEVISWIKKRLTESLNYLKKSKTSEEMGFCWGDIQPKVIIDNRGAMNFYDFEYTRICNSPGLTYIKIHGKFNKEQFDYLIERYAHHSKKSKKEIEEKILSEEKIIRVNDVIWSAMEWAKTNKDEFKKLTYKRIKIRNELDN